MRQLLICGLDFSGKTTLIKNYSKALNQYYSSNKNAAQAPQPNVDKTNLYSEIFFTTPYINIEMINMPESQIPWIVYDMSGQVSSKCMEGLIRTFLISSLIKLQIGPNTEALDA